MTTRRQFLTGLGALAAASALRPEVLFAAGDDLLLRTIPASGEDIPALGMGSWLTFNLPPVGAGRDDRVKVLRAFFKLGGGLVDSSPMYGFSEATIGHCLKKIAGDPPLFSATKVWIVSRGGGVRQMQASERLWGESQFDLMQIHNMLDWRTHLATLREWKENQRIRYIGITTSHGRRHAQLEQVITEEPDFDFVQFTYNIGDRAAERRLLPAAVDHGKAVIINRPFRRGDLFRKVRSVPLPEFASEIGCQNWAQFFLKFVISHPAVTCAIPATSRVDHMVENMGALTGPLPDAAMRRRMIDHFERI